MEQNRISLNIVGRNVRRIRKEKKWTQVVLIARCQLLGWQLSRESLAKVESGLRRVNDAEACLFAKVLGCSLDDLVGDRTEEQLLSVVRHSPEI